MKNQCSVFRSFFEISFDVEALLISRYKAWYCFAIAAGKGFLECFFHAEDWVLFFFFYISIYRFFFKELPIISSNAFILCVGIRKLNILETWYSFFIVCYLEFILEILLSNLFSKLRNLYKDWLLIDFVYLIDTRRKYIMLCYKLKVTQIHKFEFQFFKRKKRKNSSIM